MRPPKASSFPASMHPNPEPTRPPRRGSRSRVVLHAGRAALAAAVLLGGWGGAGCASQKPKPPPPAEVQEADRLARQAARLQADENWAGAAQWWMQAGKQFQLLNRLDQVAMARHNEAMARRELGATAHAHQLLEEAASLNRQTGQMSAWWRNQVALVQLENDTSPVAAARRLASLVEVGAGQEVEPRVRALLAHEEARLRASEGQLDTALAAIDRSAQGFAALGDRAGWAAATVTKAGLLRRQNELAAAATTWREALREYEQLGYPRGVAVALSGLGSTLRAAGETLESTDLLRRAAENFRTLGREKDALAVEAELKAPPGMPGR